jgi:DNA-binding beta-propeller fold protein YncE
MLVILTLASVGTSIAWAGVTDDGEVWVTSQGTHRLFILAGQGTLADIVQLPTGAGPHITTFPPSSKFAYVAGMGNGNLYILDADSRQVIQTLGLGPAGTHQAKPSPDGSLLLVAQIATNTLLKVAVDEAAQSWTVVASLPFVPLEKSPICTVFRDDGQRAYVSMLPNGIAIVDVPSMALLGTLPTDGFVACGMIKSHDGSTVTIASSGGGGHIYRLDTATDTLSDAGTLGAADWHSFNVSRNEKIGYGSSPESDELILIDLTQPTVANLGPLALDPTPGLGNDQPDAIGVRGNTVFVSLRAAGKLAVIKMNQRRVSYVDISPPTPFNPINCAGCAIHGVTIRP